MLSTGTGVGGTISRLIVHITGCFGSGRHQGWPAVRFTVKPSCVHENIPLCEQKPPKTLIEALCTLNIVIMHECSYIHVARLVLCASHMLIMGGLRPCLIPRLTCVPIAYSCVTVCEGLE